MANNIESQIIAAAQGWADAFNRGNAEDCAACYTETASLRADPVANIEGREAVQEFWAGLIADGYSEVRYIGPKVTVIDDDNATLSASWSMNKAHGVIHKETWARGEDGRWRLAADHFEIAAPGADVDETSPPVH